MENLDGYKQRLQELTALIEKLAKGDLSIQELSDLERITRELHERSIILRYTALRDHVIGTEEPQAESEIEEEVEEEELVAEEPESSIDFSIFDDEEEAAPETEDISEQEPEVEEEPIVDEEPEMEEEQEIEVAEPQVLQEEQPKQSAASGSFFDRLDIPDNSVASRFSGGKLESLIGAFGLNERLRYINDLFDGSSELFSDAIKVLDSQQNLDSAKLKIAELARDHAWDPEEEVVVEFVTYINRRYA